MHHSKAFLAIPGRAEERCVRIDHATGDGNERGENRASFWHERDRAGLPAVGRFVQARPIEPHIVCSIDLAHGEPALNSATIRPYSLLLSAELYLPSSMSRVTPLPRLSLMMA